MTEAILGDPAPAGNPKKLNDILPGNDMPLLTLLQVSQTAVIIADENSKIVFWNEGAEKMFQWSAAETVGKDLTMIMPEKYREKHLQGIKRIREGDKQHLLSSKIIGGSTQLEGIRKDGSLFSLELQIVVYVQNEKICFLATLTDLTETVKVAVAKGVEKELTTALDAMHHNLSEIATKVEKITDRLDKNT